MYFSRTYNKMHFGTCILLLYQVLTLTQSVVVDHQRLVSGTTRSLFQSAVRLVGNTVCTAHRALARESVALLAIR